MEPLRRVAVRIDGDPVPSFVARAIDEVVASPGVELAAVLVDPTGAGGPARRRDRLYDIVERRVYRGGPPALAAVALAPTVAARRVDAVGPAAVRDALRACDADVLLDLAADQLPPAPDPGSLPPLGHWAIRFSAGLDGPREGSVARRAAADGLGVAILEARLPDGRCLEVARHIGSLPAVGHVRARDALLWAASNLPARALRRRDASVAGADVVPQVPARAADRAGTRPGWRRLLATTALRVIERAWYGEAWEVLVRPAGGGPFPPRDLAGFHAVAPPPGRFYADPFLAAAGGAVRLFVEVSPRGRHEGSIAVLAAGPSGTWTGPERVLELGRHLAYPHVIDVGGAAVLTPDDGTGGAVVAYREAASSGGWEPAATLLAGVRAADPTLLEHEGRLWLFVTLSTFGMAPWDELHLFSAPGLDGPWEPHPANPVVADARRARAAGRILRVGDRLLRPAQDCSMLYGRRVILCEITRLDRETYVETPVGTIEPEGFRGARRTHTYTTAGSWEAADALVRRPRLAALIGRRGHRGRRPASRSGSTAP